MKKGIIAGIGAGVFWGLPFVVPNILINFSALEVVVGRFLFFGAISLLFLPCAIKLFTSLSLKDRLLVVAFSVSGFCLYSFLLFIAVRYTNGIISSLIEGMMPVVIILFSRPRPNWQLLSGIIAILLGLFFLLIFPVLDNISPITADNAIGILLLLICLFMWVWFAIYNAKFLKRHPTINLGNYTALIGIINLIFISPLLLFSNNFSYFANHPQIYSYLFWTMTLGIGSSWIANWLWSFCSKNCPLSVSGVLIVSETVFGLTYSLIFQQRLPYGHEVTAIILLIVGVILAIKSQDR